jgi:hypothetical protein
MPVGSLLGGLGLVGLVHADHPAAYLAVWMLIGLATAASLYDAAFATLGRIFGSGARAPITAITLAGGLASTVSWPTTHVLIEAYGWRGAYLAYAALLVLVVAPLHAFALPRRRSAAAPQVDGGAPRSGAVLPSRGRPFMIVASAFAAYGFILPGLSAHLLAIFGRAGIDAATVVTVGALFGPAQVASRVCEFVFARGIHPLHVARFAVAMLLTALALIAVLGISAPVAAMFMIMFGMANGLITIARGTLPLALFGPTDYGALIGRIARPVLLMQAIAPLVLAFVAERVSDAAVLMVVATLALVAFSGFSMVRRPA